LIDLSDRTHTATKCKGAYCLIDLFDSDGVWGLA
jgi:hypothetical protein